MNTANMYKNTVVWLLSIIIHVLLMTQIQGQPANEAIMQEEIRSMIGRMVDSLETYYVSVAEGQKIGAFLESQYQSGAYSDISDPDSLAKVLTRDLRVPNGDLHLYVKHRPVGMKINNDEEDHRVDTRGAWTNYGYQEIRILDGNVGYLNITHFTSWTHFESARQAVDRTMSFLQNKDALIIDVRKNRGGFENIVAYLISYFFDGPSIHLSDYYYRYGNSRYGIYTSTDLPYAKLPEVPIYILTSSKTASAGESFAYIMKHLGRGTVIGEITSGAGYGALWHSISDRFIISISSEEVINTVTGTGFQIVGVQPDIQISEGEAMDLAYEKALLKISDSDRSEVHRSNYLQIIKNINLKEE